MNMKKLFLLNLPYLLFVYPFDKLAQAFRLAPGADLSGKLLSIGDGFTTALSSSPWLSFHPTDLLIGIASAVILRMAVYLKGKNAKKYRHGIEYGSARWGTAADIAPYMDKDFFQNIPMTQTERITMASRPKQPKYARNKNILVIGGSGSGKTRFFCKPSLLQAHFLGGLFMAFFNSAVGVLQTLVVALGAGLGIWGVINLLEGYGQDNPASNAHVR